MTVILGETIAVCRSSSPVPSSLPVSFSTHKGERSASSLAAVVVVLQKAATNAADVALQPHQ